MTKLLIAVAILFAAPALCIAQKKTIAVIGSSTAFGLGASPIDSSWVNLSRDFYEGMGVVDTIIDLAQPGDFSFYGMPDGSMPPAPYNTGSFDPITSRNVTKALSFNPDIVIISYPTNDIGSDVPLSLYLSNLRTMYNTVVAAGKICYIATTQPRNGFNPTEARALIDGRDSIEMEFPLFNLNFFTPIAASPTNSTFNPTYNADGTHPNNAGHQLLFQVVKSNIVLTNPLVITLSDFTAGMQDGSTVLRWTCFTGTDPTVFEVQRSSDGNNFSTIHQENGKIGTATVGYSWTDNDPLPGNLFYRLKITQSQLLTYSRVVSLLNRQTRLIGKIISSVPGSLEVEINALHNGPMELAIYSASGALLARQSYQVSQPSSRITLAVPGLSTGLYFLKITANGGENETRSFIRL